MKTCKKCNLSYDDDKKFCKNCGSPLKVAEVEVLSVKVNAQIFVFEEKLKANKLNLELLTEYAQFLYDNSEYEKSISILYRILAINDKIEFADKLLFDIFIKIEKVKDAIEIGNKLLINNEKDISLLNKLAELSSQLKDKEKELYYYDIILELDPNDIPALLFKSKSLIEENKVIESLSYFKKLSLSGKRDRLTIIYGGLSFALDGEYNMAIENFKNNLALIESKKNDVHFNRYRLYWSYCLYSINSNLFKVGNKFSTVDFETLKSEYSETDEEITLKIISHLINETLKLTKAENATRYLDEIIFQYLIPTESYFSQNSNVVIADCWYNLSIKQQELGLCKEAFISCQKALIINPSGINYSDKLSEIKNAIDSSKASHEKRNTYAALSFIVLIVIGTLSYILTLKRIENKIWSVLESQNIEASFKDYLNKYPKGKYSKEAKQRYDSILWDNALSVNNYETYKFYLDSSYFKTYTLEADTLQQKVLWDNAVLKNSNDAYQRYIDLFPHGKYSEKVNLVLDKKLWEKTVRDGTENAFETYLEKFPSGKYLKEANDFLDDFLWDYSISQDSYSGYENYKSRFPNGKHVNRANSRLEYLQIIQNRKSDLSWLYGRWSVQTNYGYTYLDISNSKNAILDGEYGTYSVDGNTLTFRGNSSNYGVTYSINYKNMYIDLGGGYVMRKNN